MMRDALLAFGVAMSYAAQLSIPGLPFGYSELCLTLWIMLSMTRILAGGQLEVTPALAKLGLFWLILALAMGVGYIIGFLTTTLFLDPLLHDTLAYVLLACVTCLAAAEPNASFRLRRIAWWMVAVANAGFIIQVGLGFGWLHQAGVEPWYWDRFCGWSDNPNQLALYCALLGPLALHLATTTSNKWGRCLALCSLIFTVYVGRLTKSDTYLYTTVLACLILLGLRVRAWLTSDGNKASLSRQLAVLMAVGFLPLALSIAPYALSEASSAEDFAKSLTKDKGGEATAQTAALRLYLWNAALEKGARSGSLGLGPGPHLDSPPVVNQQFLPRPFEAHSTILDLYTQGGLISVLALMWIFGSAALSAWRAKLDALVALVASIAVFSAPHLVIRHPIVWFCLTLCLVAGTPEAIPAIVRQRRC
ncbi:polymerase [Mesorhizobium sp. C416B]|uniref:O-antigen ligase family protein n=1 Tax=unclassified Mesorhizobium TaxID=325217 RepID=UPI0003CDD98D|nr:MULTISPECIES: polymerase [unclassified Mesorhizobium]ESX55889.1 polymerase [Mesorhizobium sp. LSHC424B00]ESX23446.1 polymerase [Mesorhizobium sp. LSJC264A00]ESX49349.1 polymerase [Mesorhizobium sp. LSHC426A00]ESX72737.1 polymerase [Mesorhizobium sp. LSHC416B00]WJI62253.1 polymerase [Mesorhizobium sp. C416B]